MALNIKFNDQSENIKDAEAERALMCQAHNCSNRWSVNRGERLCSAHAWADPMDWGAITRYEASKALTRPSRPTEEPMEPMSAEEKRYILEQFKQVMRTTDKDHKAWAKRLQAKERAGDILSDYQKKAWRSVIKATS